jgi:hypothetical protein
LKFQDESSKAAEAVARRSTGASDSPLCIHGSPDKAPIRSYRHLQHTSLPNSKLDTLTSAYISHISPQVAINVHLPWNFGPFLEDIPARLGHNEALDAAVRALVRGQSALRRNERVQKDQASLHAYSAALRSLSETLAHPIIAGSTETLCAIKILMIFEVIAGFGSESALQHAGGAAKIFKARAESYGIGESGNDVKAYVGPKDKLEEKLMLSLRGPVVLHSLFLEKEYFSAVEWRQLTENKIGATSVEEKAFRCLAEYARLFRSARDIAAMRRELNAPTSSPILYPSSLKSQTANLETDTIILSAKLLPHLEALRTRFWELDTALSATQQTLLTSEVMQENGPGPTKHDIWLLNVGHAHIGRSYGVAMSTQILINALLIAFTKWNMEDAQGLPNQAMSLRLTALLAENHNLAIESSRFADQVSRHRPLGTAYMGLVLRTAYLGTETVAVTPLATKGFHSQDAKQAPASLRTFPEKTGQSSKSQTSMDKISQETSTLNLSTAATQCKHSRTQSQASKPDSNMEAENLGKRLRTQLQSYVSVFNVDAVDTSDSQKLDDTSTTAFRSDSTDLFPQKQPGLVRSTADTDRKESDEFARSELEWLKKYFCLEVELGSHGIGTRM